MDVFDPRRPDGVALAGTFAANPVSMGAGLAALGALDAAAIERIDMLGERCAPVSPFRVRGHRCGLALQAARSRSARLVAAAVCAGVLIAADGLISVSTAMDEAVIDRALDLFGVAGR